MKSEKFAASSSLKTLNWFLISLKLSSSHSAWLRQFPLKSRTRGTGRDRFNSPFKNGSLRQMNGNDPSNQSKDQELQDRTGINSHQRITGNNPFNSRQRITGNVLFNQSRDQELQELQDTTGINNQTTRSSTGINNRTTGIAQDKTLSQFTCQTDKPDAQSDALAHLTNAHQSIAHCLTNQLTILSARFQSAHKAYRTSCSQQPIPTSTINVVAVKLLDSGKLWSDHAVAWLCSTTSNSDGRVLTLTNHLIVWHLFYSTSVHEHEFIRQCNATPNPTPRPRACNIECPTCDDSPPTSDLRDNWTKDSF